MNRLTKSIMTMAIISALSTNVLADNRNDLQDLKINDAAMGLEEAQLRIAVASHERATMQAQQQAFQQDLQTQKNDV